MGDRDKGGVGGTRVVWAGFLDERQLRILLCHALLNCAQKRQQHYMSLALCYLKFLPQETHVAVNVASKVIRLVGSWDAWVGDTWGCGHGLLPLRPSSAWPLLPPHPNTPSPSPIIVSSRNRTSHQSLTLPFWPQSRPCTLGILERLIQVRPPCCRGSAFSTATTLIVGASTSNFTTSPSARTRTVQREPASPYVHLWDICFPGANTRQGNDAFAAGDWKEAIRWYTVSIKAKPNDHRPWSNRSQTNLQLER